MSVKQRLIEYAKTKERSVRAFEINAGLTIGYVNAIRVSIQPDKIQRIASYYKDLNTNWLLTGEGEMLKSTEPSDASLAPKGKLIRYWVDVDATAGGIQLFDDTLTSNYIDLSIPEFRDCTDAVNLFGDSMYPLYKPGQIIILKRWEESFIDYGNVYLIITKKGNRMVKYIRRHEIAGKVMCVSENPDHDPFPLDIEDINALFIVKGAIAKNVM